MILIESEVPSLAKVSDFLSVIHEPSDPDPQRRYKCVYIAHPPFQDVRGGRSGIGPRERRWGAFIAATSADGLSWKVVGDRPMNAGGERFEVSGLYRFGNFYYAPGQLISQWSWRMDGSKIGRVMLTYRSPDFLNWSRAKASTFARPGQLTSTPFQGQQTHMGAGLWNRGNVVVGLYGMWQDAEKKPADGKYWNTLTVELLDGFDRSIPGFSAGTAATIREAGTRKEVVWSKPIPSGREFAVRVTFSNRGDAKLYALYVGGR